MVKLAIVATVLPDVKSTQDVSSDDKVDGDVAFLVCVPTKSSPVHIVLITHQIQEVYLLLKVPK